MPEHHVYSETTRSIMVSVSPFFVEEQSSIEEGTFVFAYHVRIENAGTTTVQLRSRYWRIIDGLGRVEEVRGSGVVGEQPVIAPGESFEYTSGAPLSTPSGIMGGSYRMESAEGEVFDVTIPSFSLDSPYVPATIN